jgi:hypothetical protein
LERVWFGQGGNVTDHTAVQNFTGIFGARDASEMGRICGRTGGAMLEVADKTAARVWIINNGRRLFGF